MLSVFGGEVLGCMGPPSSARPVKDMPGVVDKFYGIFSIVVGVLDMVAAFGGFSIINPVRRPLDMSGKVCGSSGGDDLPSVGYKIL